MNAHIVMSMTRGAIAESGAASHPQQISQDLCHGQPALLPPWLVYGAPIAS